MKRNQRLSQTVHAFWAVGLVLLAFGLFATNSSAEPKAPSAASLISKWKNAIYTNREHSHLGLTILEPGSSPLKRQGEIWFKTKNSDDSRIFLKFGSPASIRGVAFLSLQSAGHDGADQWLYFPSYRKARRLSSHNRDDSFLDSDFSNGDISFEYEASFLWAITGEKKIENQDCYVVEGKIIPSKKGTFAYAREVMYVTKTDNLNLRSEFYDSSNSLVKILTVSKWKKYNNRWAADLVKVENAKTKHQSLLEFSDRRLDQDPPDRLFTLGELESGH
jgi:hypothetical protein